MSTHGKNLILQNMSNVYIHIFARIIIDILENIKSSRQLQSRDTNNMCQHIKIRNVEECPRVKGCAFGPLKKVSVQLLHHTQSSIFCKLKICFNVIKMSERCLCIDSSWSLCRDCDEILQQPKKTGLLLRVHYISS